MPPKKYTFIKQVWFQYQTSSFNLCSFFPQSQVQCGILLHRSFDIIDLKTQTLECGDSQPEICDFEFVMYVMLLIYLPILRFGDSVCSIENCLFMNQIEQNGNIAKSFSKLQCCDSNNHNQ